MPATFITENQQGINKTGCPKMDTDVYKRQVLNTKYGFRAHNEFTAIYGKGGTNTLSWLLAYGVIKDCNGVSVSYTQLFEEFVHELLDKLFKPVLS